MSSNIKNMINQYQNSRINEETKLREILQQTALLGLERHGFFEKAAFYGGTALRILYGLDRDRVLELLKVKIQQIDWESAKADVRTFIADPERLKIWTPQFFLDIIKHLKVE